MIFLRNVPVPITCYFKYSIEAATYFPMKLQIYFISSFLVWDNRKKTSEQGGECKLQKHC